MGDMAASYKMKKRCPVKELTGGKPNPSNFLLEFIES